MRKPFAAFGFVALLAAGANTPVAAAIMGIELLPHTEGVYAALAARTAFLIVGQRFRAAVETYAMDARAEDLPRCVRNPHRIERDCFQMPETPIELPSWIDDSE